VEVNSNKLKTLASSGLAVVAIALSGVAIYTTNAGAQASGAHPAHDGKPVNVPAPAPTGAAPASFADIVQRVAPAVVSIDIEEKVAAHRGGAKRGPESDEDEDGGDDSGQALPPELRRFFQQHGRGVPQEQGPQQPAKASGSGFFIASNGYIVTNNHVVESAADITVHTADDKILKAHLIGRDPATDLAVIKVEGAGFPFVSFEDKSHPRVGDWVIAVGNPFGLGGTATAGIVSALARQNVADGPYVDYMQIDAPINPGNSGGPSFDLDGRVVGVNSAIFSRSGGSVGIGFDIPADVAQQITKELIVQGKITRGYIGASVQGLTDEIAASLGVKTTKGALVASLTPGGPAQRAGLMTGDLVTRIDGHDVVSNSDLTRRVGMVRVGQDLHLSVIREGKPTEITIKAGERPSEEALAANEQGQPGPRRR
jgi:serine protease Do